MADTPKPSKSRLRLNTRGWLYLVLTLTIGGVAAARGNNLLFVVASALMGFFVTSFLLTLASSRGIQVTRVVPESAFAGEIFNVTLRFHNSRRFWPVIALKFEDQLSHDGRLAQTQPTFLYLPVARPGATLSGRYSLAAYTRGWATLGPIKVTAEFPPGLFSCRQKLEVTDTILVWPRQGFMTRRVLNPYLARLDYEDVAPVLYSVGDEEFAGLREFRPGDPPRRIHWKMSARLQDRLLVREFEDSRVRDAVILLETYIANPKDRRRKMRLERAISFAGALAESLLQDNYRVAFRAFGPDRMEVRLEPGRENANSLYAALALLQPSRSATLAEIMAAEEPGAGKVYFILRIGEDRSPERMQGRPALVFDAAEMRRLMYYAI